MCGLFTACRCDHQPAMYDVTPVSHDCTCSTSTLTPDTMEVFVGQPLFKPGDLVKHPLRPEWGDGEVRQVALTKYNGKEGQRLVIVFKNHGKVTINTAVVQLNAKDKANNDMKSAQSADWLSDIEAQQGNRQNNLTGLPESITDPFTDIITRVERTLGDYKYTDQNPRSLLDWAMRQTGMDDPLSQYTRHDLEEAFKRYVYLRYKHLLELVRTVKRSNKRPLLEALLTKTLPNGAANDLRKAISA